MKNKLLKIGEWLLDKFLKVFVLIAGIIKYFWKAILIVIICIISAGMIFKTILAALINKNE